MTDTIEQLDISAISDYRRHIGRASVAGTIGGLLLVWVSVQRAFQQSDSSGVLLLYIGTGAGIVMLSLLLRRGSVAAASLLSPVVVIGIILGLKMLVARLRGAALGNIVSTLILTGLVFLPIFLRLISGIEAVFDFSENRLSESFPRLDFRSLHNPLTVADEGLHQIEQQLARATAFLMLSEAMVLIGSSSLLVDALWRVFSVPQPGMFALVGFVLLILGLNLNLRAVRLVTRKMRERLLGDPRPQVLLLSTCEENQERVPARLTLPRILNYSYPRIPLLRVICEQMLALGPVVTLNEPGSFSGAGYKRSVKEPMKGIRQIVDFGGTDAIANRPASNGGEGGSWQGKLEYWMNKAGCVVMVLGRTKCLGWHFTPTVKGLLRQKGLLVFPPVSDSHLYHYWQGLCEQLSSRRLSVAVLKTDLARGVLLVFRGNRKPLLITARIHDEWSYEVAFRIAAATMGADRNSPQLRPSDKTTLASGELAPGISGLPGQCDPASS